MSPPPPRLDLIMSCLMFLVQRNAGHLARLEDESIESRENESKCIRVIGTLVTLTLHLCITRRSAEFSAQKDIFDSKVS